MSVFESAFEITVGHEGGFVDDPTDSGGATKFGITEKVARANSYEGPMQSLSLEDARQIAKRQYWDVLRLDEVAKVSPDVAAEVFDTSYNMGTGRAGRFLQRALTALNRKGADYDDLEVDGVVGPVTLTAVRAYLGTRGEHGETVLLRALNCQQGEAYIELAENREKDERFLFGWLLNRVS